MKDPTILNRIAAATPGLMLLGTLLFGLYNPSGTVSAVRELGFDIYQRIAPRETRMDVPPRTLVVEIDRARAARAGLSPDDLLSRVLGKLSGAGPVAVLLDLQPAPSRATDRGRQIGPRGTRAFLAQVNRNGIATVAGLVAAGKSAPLVTSFRLATDMPDEVTRQAFAPVRHATIESPGGDAATFLPSGRSGLESPRALVTISRGNGASYLTADRFSPVRTLPLMVSVSGAVIPTLALEGLRVAEGGTSLDVEVRNPQDLLRFAQPRGVQSVSTDKTRIPTHADGSLRLHFAKIAVAPVVDALEVVNDALDPELLRNRIVLIGMAPTEETAYLTPRLEVMSGTRIAAEALEQVNDGAFLQRLHWFLPAEQLAMIFAGLLVIAGFVWVGTLAGGVTLGLVLVAFGYAGWHAFTEMQMLLDPLVPGLSVATVGIATGLVYSLRGRAEADDLIRQFDGRIRSRSLSRLLSHRKLIDPTGQLREITCLRTEMRDFNIIADRYLEDPHGYNRVVNEFFEPISKIVTDRFGMVDKYVGDSLIAAWNAVEPDTEHAAHACQTALRITEAIDHINEILAADARERNLSYIPVSPSIALESGNGIAAHFGSSRRLEYSVVGEPVTFAGYLLKNSRTYGPSTIVGEGTYKLVGDRFAMIEIDLVATARNPAGRRVFALVGDKIKEADPKFRALREGHERILRAYRNQRWEDAEAAIAECRKLQGAIPTLCDFYEERINFYRANPPGEHWNGAWYAGRL